MDGIVGKRVEELFDRAMDLSPEERQGFLDAACDGNADLQGRVEELLKLAERAGDFLVDPTVEPQAATRDELEGDCIGPFKLLQRIGEGGFGEVYLAEQNEPVCRKVALKILKAGMDSKQVLARFEAERQALAMMEHPNIARVLDAGPTETGRPYFAMELVDGVPITVFCDTEHLTIRRRLELFVEVCQAVQHAHTKGVIHRDIKPSNVLVAMQDGKPTPKVIDFGIAKAIDQPLTDKTLFTEARQFIGTPEYMSPEQVQLGGSDIDTRSDVYSLGVLLYELLTGCTPFDRKELRESSIDELRRTIREVEPAKPSTRVSTLARVAGPRRQRSDAAAEIAADVEDDSGAAALQAAPRTGASAPSSIVDIARQRSADPSSLRRVLQGDLDWIVIRCLEKDRTRRYGSASTLAADVDHHLAGEPVVAAPPSRAYRLRKFIRRNRGSVVAGALVACALLIGFGVAVWQAVRAQQAADLAEQRLKETEQIAKFQASLLPVSKVRMGDRLRDVIEERLRAALKLEGVDESEIEAAEVDLERLVAHINFTEVAVESVRANIIEDALPKVDEQFAGQPLVQAQLLHSVGLILRRLGLHEEALAQDQRALDIRTRELGETHPLTIASQSRVAGALNGLCRFTEAERLMRDVLAFYRSELGAEDRRTISAIIRLGMILDGRGKYDECVALYREALELARSALGEEHPTTMSAMGALAYVLEEVSPLEAEQYYRETLRLRRKLYGDGSGAMPKYQAVSVYVRYCRAHRTFSCAPQ